MKMLRGNPAPWNGNGNGLGRERRRGVAAVELAVVMPVMMAMLVGMFELGQMVRVRQVLDNAVREAGRQASLGKKPVSVADPTNPVAGTIKDAVETYITQSKLNSKGLIVRVTTPGGGANTSAGSDVDPRLLNATTSQLQPDRFRVVASLPYESDGAGGGNRIVHIKFRIINVPKVSAFAEWYSMKDFPLLEENLAPPVEL